MAVRSVDIPGIGALNLYKRRGVRHIRLSISQTGDIRVTMPTWVPYAAGIEFAKQKTDWLKQHSHPKTYLLSGSPVGKTRRLEFISGAKEIRTRVTQGVVRVHLPDGISEMSSAAQSAAQRACVRALRDEAEAILPGRLRGLAAEHGFDFRSVEVKRLKSRWGSCNHRHEIVLNCFLMQLPWHLIDYVLLHELAHTKVLAHGPRFWSLMQSHVPNLKSVRQEIRTYRPLLG